MPLGMAVEILEQCDMRNFAGTGAVVCQPTDLSNPAQEVCFLNQRRDMIQVKYVQHDRIHCKVLELALNYHERMIPYAFRVPPTVGKYGRLLEDAEWLQKCSRYIEKWIDLINKEKQWQDMHTPEHMWPPWPPRSEVESVFDMPMVMWLSKEKKTVCTPDNDGQTLPADGGTWYHHNYYMPSGFGMQSGDFSF